MSDNRADVIKIEASLQALMREKGEILAVERSLTAAEVDRLFEIHEWMERWFEHQSMLLPLIEEEKTQSRWDSPFSREVLRTLDASTR